MDIIISPVITEKSMKDAAKSRFTFKVSNNANKESIKKVIEKKFSVDVVKISSMVMKGKLKRFGARRVPTQTSSYKKAVVTLKAGQKIGLFELGGDVK